MRKPITTAAVAAMLLSAGVALAAAPVCGDVNDDGSIKTTDALLVLKKAVALPISLDCSAYDDQFSACETSLAGANASLSTCNSDLSTTNADLGTCAGDLATCEAAPVCGDGVVAGDEDCDIGSLSSHTCVTQGFAGGQLACSFCTFDTTGCYATRFDASGATIIDHQTGLEWEKKDSAGGGSNLANAHDVDNQYQWSSTGTAPDGGAFTDFLAKLNGGTSTGVSTTGCYEGHCDWRLPALEELEGVPWPAVSDFQPDAASPYWSASTYASYPTIAWFVATGNGTASNGDKSALYFARAVRSGS